MVESQDDERTPPVTLHAVYSAVLRCEAQSKLAASHACAAYEQSKRWAAVERKVTIAAFAAALFALAALLISIDSHARARDTSANAR